MILKLMFMMFPKKSPAAPYPICKKTIVDPRYTPVVMIDIQLYLFIESFPFAKRNASITPLSPKNTSNTA